MHLTNQAKVFLWTAFSLMTATTIFLISQLLQPEPPLNLNPIIDNSKNQFEEEGDKKEGPAHFAEYHHSIRTRIDQEDSAYPGNYRVKELEKARRNHISFRNNDPLPWIERGPGNVGGRTRGIWVDPDDSTHRTWFVGSAGGGVWKTENGGFVWEHVTEDLPNIATSTVMGSPANPNVLYVGTGEGFASRDIIGSGMWKSIDKGETWTALLATQNNSQFSHILRIVVNPEDEDELVIATRHSRREDIENGDPVSYIYRSVNGGNNWQRTYVSDYTVQQIVAHPTDFNTLFASVNSMKILRSLDAGRTWNEVFDATTRSIGRMELAISPTDPNYIYFAAPLGRSQSLLYRSIDGGATWHEIRPVAQRYDFRNWLNGQGWYDNAIAVHPFDKETVFVGGAGPILKITVGNTVLDNDGTMGATMEPVTDGYFQHRDNFPNASTKGVHVDHHNLTLIPIDSATGEFYILNGNDGGIAFSTDGGDTFRQTGDSFSSNGAFPTFSGYNTSQFYGLDKANGSDIYVGGTQDNGSWVSSVNPDETSKWIDAPSGDGFEAAWHYDDPRKVLESSQFNNIYRSDGSGQRNTWRRVNPPGSGPGAGPFLTRIANSKIDPEMVFTVSILGVGASYDFADSWSVVSMPQLWNFRGSSTVIEAAVASNLVVWTGSGISEDNRITVSKNGGGTFTPTSNYTQAELGSITGIATHPFDEETAYALFSIPDAPKILKTTDYGETWTDISGFVTNKEESDNGFPDVATYCLVVMPFDTNMIWVGTDIGLFESTDGGASWHIADNGLPPVSIWEMKIVNDEVILATHGRGIWTVALPELQGYEPPEAVALVPLLEVDAQSGFDGLVSGTYNLRSDYDSSFVAIEFTAANGSVVSNRIAIGDNDIPVSDLFEVDLDGFPEDTIITAQVRIISYKDGLELSSVREAQIYEVSEDPVVQYFNDFNGGQKDFARLGFNVYQEVGFESKALHSPHPYPNNSEFIAVLEKPIVVSETYSLISYDEIVMVEPGSSPVFGSPRFWDFVVVEGTRDRGRTWETIEGYDSQYSPNWQANFVEDARSVDPALVETHIVDLTNTFSVGETIYLRFRLESDPEVEGWGWMIDNINIQNSTVDSEDLEPTPIATVSTYPNPFQNNTILNYHLPSKERVTVDVFNMAGQLLVNLQNADQTAGNHQLTFDGSDLAPGIYLCRFKAGNFVKTIRWVKQ